MSMKTDPQSENTQMILSERNEKLCIPSQLKSSAEIYKPYYDDH